MKTVRQPDSPTCFLTDNEVDEFRVLMEQHAGLRLSAADARVLSGQLLRVLALIRDVVVTSVEIESGAVDNAALPEGKDRSIN